MKPIEGPSNTGDRKYSHPAFGQISVSRVSGKARLYGSDFEHQHYVVVELKHSEEHWSSFRPWHFAEGTVASIAMTEAQWAQFVSSFNVGTGTPCTIELERQGDLVRLPPITPLKPRADEYKNDFMATIGDAATALRDALKAAKERKVHSSIIAGIETALRELVANTPFVEKQFAEHVEELVEEAKIEANAFLDHAIKTAGLGALRNENLQVPSPAGGVTILPAVRSAGRPSDHPEGGSARGQYLHLGRGNAERTDEGA